MRARAHDPEVAQLVNSINESVDALEGLFSELLDISRIDSGGVEVNPENFELADIFRKVRLHFEPAAFEKGLALRIRGGRHVALADPLLVERIVRNLVSNAIRYTQDGSVLLSCRRRGERLLLQVWDTGPGIRAEERARIFEEFYQVPGVAAVTVEQKKGLGLGLAIVKRLCALMAVAARPALAGRPRLGVHGRAAARQGAAHDGAIDPRQGADRHHPRRPPDRHRRGRAGGARRPRGAAHRLGRDHRLARERRRGARLGRGRRPGGAAGARHRRLPARATARPASPRSTSLRERFGRGVPAIVVTGSSMTGHDKEALEHDFHLLIKPVLPNKLRAMIAFKLGRR